MRRGNLAYFISLKGCPYPCVYCDQRRITGKATSSPDDCAHWLLEALPRWRGNTGQLAFFGGTFTGLPQEEMAAYLALAEPLIEQGIIDGVRISTRPDRIAPETLCFLKAHGVTHIELGVQSLDDDVLRASGRGYTEETVIKSARLIRAHGFVLGLQMMTGLPLDTPDKSRRTARRIIELGAAEMRVYPTLVLNGTPLAELWRQGRYRPPALDETVALCAELKELFEQAGVKILKIGLHSGALESSVLAGPFHPAFGQLVNSALCRRLLSEHIRRYDLHDTVLYVCPSRFDASDIVGQHGANRKFFSKTAKISLEIRESVLTNSARYVIL